MSDDPPFTPVAGAACSLILISNPRISERWDFEKVAALVREQAPDIQTAVLEDRPVDWRTVSPQFTDKPTLVVSPGPLKFFRPHRGKVFRGLSMKKSQECVALERAGVPIPRWGLVTKAQTPDMTEFGPYVVVKPDWSGRGADVKIFRKGRVRWRPPETDYTVQCAGEACDWVVQEFIYTGPHPVSYRVATLFGKPLWAWKIHADPMRRAMTHRYDFGHTQDGGGISVVASGKRCIYSLVDDAEVLELAATAHRALPERPLLGVDVLRDAETGKLFVLELNSVGFAWHLTSPMGLEIQKEFNFDLDARFDVRRKAAANLAEQTRLHAV